MVGRKGKLSTEAGLLECINRLNAYNQRHMGIAEISGVFGVSTQLVFIWLKTGHLSQPLSQLKMGPVWDRYQIRAWLQEQIRQLPQQ